MIPVRYRSDPSGRVVTVCQPHWRLLTGQAWTDADAAQWCDWIDGRDVDRFLRTWTDAHRHQIPMLNQCRMIVPPGRAVQVQTTAQPSEHGGLVGLTHFTVLE